MKSVGLSPIPTLAEREKEWLERKQHEHWEKIVRKRMKSKRATPKSYNRLIRDLLHFHYSTLANELEEHGKERFKDYKGYRGTIVLSW